MNEKNSYVEYGKDREIDIWQLGLVVLSKWKILMLCIGLGAIMGFLITQRSQITNSSTTDELTEEYQKQKEDYDRTKAIYEKYIDQVGLLIEEGIPDDIPEGSTKLEQAWYLSNTINIYNSIKAQKEALIEQDLTGKTKEIGTTEIIKVVMAGMIGGGMIGFLGIALCYMLSGRVLSAHEIGQRYGIRVLSALSEGKKDKVLSYGKDRVYLRESIDEQIKTASMSVRSLVQDTTDIIMAGTIGEKALMEVTNRMKLNLEEYGIIPLPFGNEDFYRMINHKSVVILVEDILDSRYSVIDNEMRILNDLNADVLGVIGIYNID